MRFRHKSYYQQEGDTSTLESCYYRLLSLVLFFSCPLFEAKLFLCLFVSLARVGYV